MNRCCQYDWKPAGLWLFFSKGCALSWKWEWLSKSLLAAWPFHVDLVCENKGNMLSFKVKHIVVFHTLVDMQYRQLQVDLLSQEWACKRSTVEKPQSGCNEDYYISNWTWWTKVNGVHNIQHMWMYWHGILDILDMKISFRMIACTVVWVVSSTTKDYHS